MAMDKKHLKKLIVFEYETLRQFCIDKSLNYSRFSNWLHGRMNYKEAEDKCKKEFPEVK